MFRAHCLAWLIALVHLVTPNTPASAQGSNRSLRGKLVYFGQADSENAQTFWIKAQSRNGADEKIAAIEAGASSGRVSPMGDRMAFCSQHEGKCGIWLMSSDGRERSLLVEAAEDSWIGGWSPDGTQLVYGSGGDDQRVHFQIELRTKAVTPIRLPATEVIWDWSPDGREWLTISMQPGGRQIQRVRVDGSGLTRLTDPATDNISPRYAPDGARLVTTLDPSKRTLPMR